MTRTTWKLRCTLAVSVLTALAPRWWLHGPTWQTARQMIGGNKERLYNLELRTPPETVVFFCLKTHGYCYTVLPATSWSDFAMPRQPYHACSASPPSGLDVGANALGQRPHLESLVGHCLMAWPNVEAEMALALGQILGANNTAAIAVFQQIRRFSSQRDIFEAAARASLSATDQELIGAILNVHKSAESERTPLAHGHFGVANNIPDGLIWMNTSEYVAVRVILTLKGVRQFGDDRLNEIASKLWVYKKQDLIAIIEANKALAWIWNELIIYLQTTDETRRAELYGQLCERPQINSALAQLRQKNVCKRLPAREPAQ